MDRNIPHVLDIFTSSPGVRRRAIRDREAETISSQRKEQDKNAGSDSAVSLGSSEEEDENDRNISKYFDYLNEVEDNLNKRRKSKYSVNKNIKSDSRRKDDKAMEFEKDIKYIDKHLSMKKTIRKKMMRDLQQAFVENPGEFQQDHAKLPPDKKSIIDLHNLTLCKKKMSKSEHSFLDMLKDDDNRKKHIGGSKTNNSKCNFKNNQDEDSGLDSPTRSAFRSRNTQDFVETKDLLKSTKEEKKPSFWKRLTGKTKSKR